MDPKDQSTILIMDAPDLVTEVTCRSIFPNLKKFYSKDESVEQILTEGKFERIVLSTKDFTVTKYALESSDNRETDIVPYGFVCTDPAKTNEKILSKIVFLEFYRLRCLKLRNKVSFLLQLSFKNIHECIEKEHPSIQIASEYPQLFYKLAQSIESNDSLHFHEFLKELSLIPNENKNQLLEGLLTFISRSNQLLATGQLFYPFLKSFAEDENFFKVQEPVLDLMDSLVHFLRKDIFKIHGFNFTASALFTAFDRVGSYKTLETIKSIIGKSNIISNQLLQHGLSKLFQNKNYEVQNHEFDQANSSKRDNCLHESVKTILSFSKTQPDLSQKERFLLAQLISDYSTFLQKNPAESEKVKFLNKHNIRI